MFANLRFATAGEHLLRIRIDGHLVKSIPFCVLLDGSAELPTGRDLANGAQARFTFLSPQPVDFEASDQEQAATVRAEWMRLMGLPEEEIAEMCIPDPEHPFDLREELQELEAAKKLAGNAPSYEELIGWARKATRQR
jgi:hypothetical protein